MWWFHWSKGTECAAEQQLRNAVVEESLTLPMASVWCCVQICSLLTQCCLSLASVAEKEGEGSGRRVSKQPGYGHTGGASASIPRAPSSVDNSECADQYKTKLMGGDDSRLGRQWVETKTRNTSCCFGNDCSPGQNADSSRTKMFSDVVPFVSMWPCDECVSMPSPYDSWEKL